MSEPIKFSRTWAMPSHHTFTIKPISKLLERYVGNGKGWIDPMSGYNSPAEFTNDIDPNTLTQSHIEAVEWLTNLKGIYKGILFDPPYSFTQIVEHYKVLNLMLKRFHTSMHFYSRVKDAATPKIQVGGLAISFGWCSNGFGMSRGFRIIEIMLVAHGGHKNDTIVTVEIKVNNGHVY